MLLSQWLFFAFDIISGLISFIDSWSCFFNSLAIIQKFQVCIFHFFSISISPRLFLGVLDIKISFCHFPRFLQMS